MMISTYLTNINLKAPLFINVRLSIEKKHNPQSRNTPSVSNRPIMLTWYMSLRLLYLALWPGV